MVILGLDPGTAITGFGLLRVEGGRKTVIDYGTLETSKGPSDAARLMQVFDEAEDLLRRAKPDAIAIEHLFFGRNVSTMLSVGRASGVLLLAAAKAGIEIAEYTPMQVKMAVVGYGNADKKQVQAMVQRILDLPEIPKPDDVADALALAICHAHTYRIAAVNPGRVGKR
ncbi:MAG TPA: crossover junction endodeoxyribonuclease RuvC [Armatimonadota bacterium]|jgi:crossover junction endodeoxyribonuclease RuvC